MFSVTRPVSFFNSPTLRDNVRVFTQANVTILRLISMCTERYIKHPNKLLKLSMPKIFKIC